MTWHPIPEEQRSQLHCCKSLNTGILLASWEGLLHEMSSMLYCGGACCSSLLVNVITVQWYWLISVLTLLLVSFIFTEFPTLQVPSSYTSDIWFSNNGWMISNQKQKSSDLHYCPNCGKVYSWRKNLQRHLSLECGKQPHQCCPYCSYVTNHKSSVQKHIRRVHKNMPNIP